MDSKKRGYFVLNAEDRSLVLHIGSPKAGSTSLQNFLMSNRAALNGQDFQYQDMEDANKDWRIHRGLTGGDIWNPIYPKADGLIALDETQFDMFERVLALSVNQLKDYKSIILSNEFLYFIAKDPKFWKLLNSFQEVMNVKIRIFLYLRSPFDFLRSWYSESIKRGFTLENFSDYLSNPNQIFDSVYSDLPCLISLAAENCFEFDIFNLSTIGQNISSHFSQAIGFDLRDSKLGPDANTGLNAIELEFFRGVHVVSRKLGLILCNERTDIYLSNLNPSKANLTFKQQISQVSCDLIFEKLQTLNLELSNLHPTLDELIYDVPPEFTSTQPNFYMDEALRAAYEVGLMLGRSYVGGYLKRDT